MREGQILSHQKYPTLAVRCVSILSLEILSAVVRRGEEKEGRRFTFFLSLFSSLPYLFLSCYFSSSSRMPIIHTPCPYRAAREPSDRISWSAWTPRHISISTLNPGRNLAFFSDLLSLSIFRPNYPATLSPDRSYLEKPLTFYRRLVISYKTHQEFSAIPKLFSFFVPLCLASVHGVLLLLSPDYS